MSRPNHRRKPAGTGRIQPKNRKKCLRKPGLPLVNCRGMAEGMNPFKPFGKDQNSNPAAPPKQGRSFFWRIAIPVLLLELGIFIILGSVARGRAWQSFEKDEEHLAGVSSKMAAQLRLTYLQEKVPPRSTFSQFLQQQGLGAQTVHDVIQQTRPVYNLGLVRAGNRVTLVDSADGQLHAIKYQIDQNQVLMITRQAQGFGARIEKIPYVVKVVGVAGTVHDSLFQAVEAQGENGNLAVKIADIFGWDLDFNTDTRPGDQFAVVVEKKMLNGRFVSYGRVLAADYTNRHHHYRAVLFHDPSGRPSYYGPSGKSMQKAFLRSPLRFDAHVTSRFSYHRMDPISHHYGAHLGTDYAAPIGSRVQAVGDGTVIFAAWDGGAGRLIKIRHAHGYVTLYMHLSRFLVHRGERVHQGQIIGLSGTTGHSTGPHLHFGIEQDGRYRNFLTLNLPPAQSVSRKDWKQFVTVKTKFLDELASLESQPHGPEQASLNDVHAHASGRE